MRYAVYFTPAQDDELTRAAQVWLGRNAFTGQALATEPPPDFSPEDLFALTAEPRRYGFHATLAAPFRLRETLGESAVIDAARSFAEGWTPFAVPALTLSRIGNFYALTPVDGDGVAALASAVVDHFNGLRAPLSEVEIERRRPDALSARQREYLGRYGYPYVKEEFRFHMTLTGALSPQQAELVELALLARFAPLLKRPMTVGAISIFVQPRPDADFIVRSVHPFRHDRKLTRHAA